MGKATVLGAALLLAFTASADAKIVPQRSIAGVALGMSQPEVIERFGDPTSRRRAGEATVWTFPRKLTVVFHERADGVTSVTTRNRRQRTAKGIGVGSSRRAVRRALKGEHCSPFDCSLGTLAHRTRNTFFGFGADRKGPVEFVEVRLQIVDGLP